jgi:hypothetical protein
MKRVLFCIVLVFLGLVLSAGCVFDRAPPPGSDTDDENPEAKYFEEEEENETGDEESYNTMGERGYLTIVAENGSEVYACDVYGEEVVDDTGDMDEEEENDYAIDGEEVSSDRNPLDAIKDLDEYDVQDNGSTIILDTDTGEGAY